MQLVPDEGLLQIAQSAPATDTGAVSPLRRKSRYAPPRSFTPSLAQHRTALTNASQLGRIKQRDVVEEAIFTESVARFFLRAAQ